MHLCSRPAECFPQDLTRATTADSSVHTGSCMLTYCQSAHASSAPKKALALCILALFFAGHRYDSIPFANGMITSGMSCQLRLGGSEVS